MDSKFVITQLINAAVTIVTTIIVVRVTMKGNLEINPRFKQRFRSTIGKYGALILVSSGLVIIVTGLIRWVWLRRDDLPNRAEVFIISLMTFGGLYMLGAAVDVLFDIVAPKRPKSPPTENTDVQQ